MRKGPSEGWVTFILLLLSVMAAIWSMGRAHWAPTPGLYLLALWGVVLGLLLAKMRFRGWLLAINGLLVGICLSLCHLASLVEGPTSLDRFADVGSRLFTWGRAFASGEVSSDPLLVIFLFLVMSWLVGFISASQRDHDSCQRCNPSIRSTQVSALSVPVHSLPFDGAFVRSGARA
jgi:hypothetical protein